MIKHIKNIVLFSLALTTYTAFTTTPQVYKPASFWAQYARQGYTHGNDLDNRLQRGPLFIKDMNAWAIDNENIPLHTFKKNSSKLRIVTYNVRFWTDPLNNPNIEAILEVIKTLNADILILQESLWDEEILRNWNIDNLPARFEQLGYCFGGISTLSRIWAPNFKDYGTVIFSKFPLEQLENAAYRSTILGADKQGYSHVLVRIGETLISCYGTHLAAESTTQISAQAEDIREEQLRQLLHTLDLDSCPNKCIAADCNAVRRQDFDYMIEGIPAWKLADKDYIGYMGVPRPTHALALVDRHGFKNTFDHCHLATPPVTTWAGIPVDHIFLAPTWNLPIKRSYVFFSAASDHCPIIADFYLSK